MPVRINLLPRYVVLKKIFQRALIACIAGSILWVLVLLLVYANKQVELRTLQASLANVESAAQATEAAQAAKQKADSAKAPLEANVKFMLAASQTGSARRALLDLFRPYFSPSSVISQIDLTDGKTAIIQGMVRTPDDYARFITTLRQGAAPSGPLFAENPVGTSGVPGFPKQETQTSSKGGNDQNNSQLTMVVFPLSVEAKGTLLNPIIVPVAPGGKAEPKNNAGMPPGMPPGMMDPAMAP